MTARGLVHFLDSRRRSAKTTRSSTSDEAEWLAAAAEARLRYGAVTARSAGLYACPSCGLLSRRPRRAARAPRADAARSRVDCPRCGEALHIRKPASIAKTWAYIVSAFILYIPANVFPITDTRTLFDDQSDTIFSGVIYLWNEGSWPLALLVFFASITVPLAKLIVLTGLVISVQRGTLRKPRQRHDALSHRRVHRTLVDARHLRGLDPHGAGPVEEPRGGDRRPRGARVRRGLRADDPRVAFVRSTADLGPVRRVRRRPGPRR